MEKLVAGDVVVIHFPFSDLSDLKKRPALILKSISGNDLILCQITRSTYYPKEEIKLEKSDFQTGILHFSSKIRFSKLFTADKSIVDYKAGSIKRDKLKKVVRKLCKLLK